MVYDVSGNVKESISIIINYLQNVYDGYSLSVSDTIDTDLSVLKQALKMNINSDFNILCTKPTNK